MRKQVATGTARMECEPTMLDTMAIPVGMAELVEFDSGKQLRVRPAQGKGKQVSMNARPLLEWVRTCFANYGYGYNEPLSFCQGTCWLEADGNFVFEKGDDGYFSIGVNQFLRSVKLVDSTL